MRRIGTSAVLAGLLLAAVALPARGLAWDHGHGHWHGGGHGHWHGTSVVVGVGPAFGWGYYPGYWYAPPAYYGYYPYPRAYWPAPVAREEPQVYVERPAPPLEDYWYYCESKRGYYPRVPSCPEPWTKVPAEPGR